MNRREFLKVAGAPRPVGNGSCFSSAPDMMKFLDNPRLQLLEIMRSEK